MLLCALRWIIMTHRLILIRWLNENSITKAYVSSKVLSFLLDCCTIFSRLTNDSTMCKTNRENSKKKKERRAHGIKHRQQQATWKFWKDPLCNNRQAHASRGSINVGEVKKTTAGGPLLCSLKSAPCVCPTSFFFSNARASISSSSSSSSYSSSSSSSFPVAHVTSII